MYFCQAQERTHNGEQEMYSFVKHKSVHNGEQEMYSFVKRKSEHTIVNEKLNVL